MKGESVPKKTESTGTGLESYVAKLMGNGSNRTSVTEDEIQVALKDIDVSDEQLTAVYSALRNSGIQIISASGNDDAPMDDDDNDTDTDDLPSAWRFGPEAATSGAGRPAPVPLSPRMRS